MAYAKGIEESRAFEHRAAVEQAVQFCDLAIGLNDEQRRRLTELFLNETRQMKRKESSELSLQFMMVLQTAKLSREKLKPIFDEAAMESDERPAQAAGTGRERRRVWRQCRVVVESSSGMSR